MPSCVVCGRKDIPLYRTNPKGEKGIWACEEHHLSSVDPITKDIATIALAALRTPTTTPDSATPSAQEDLRKALEEERENSEVMRLALEAIVEAGKLGSNDFRDYAEVALHALIRRAEPTS